jgi:hypothetical protein
MPAIVIRLDAKTFRRKRSDAALGKSVIGIVVFLILARQARKQCKQSKEMRTLDDKWEELAKSVEEGNMSVRGVGKSG